MSKATYDPEKQEPKENDKCMESPSNEREENGGNWKSRLTEFGNRTKTFASDNFRLVIILLCIMLIIFFIIIITLAVLLGKSGCEIPAYCSDSRCLRAAAEVVSNMNDSVDPCSDFFTYSCRDWMARFPSPEIGSHSLIDNVRSGIFLDVRHLIDLVGDEQNDEAADKKVKLFYSACMKETEIKFWSFQLLMQSIGEVGGWDIINSAMKPSWDRTKVLAKLQASFGVHAFLKISVGADNRNPSRNIIKLHSNLTVLDLMDDIGGIKFAFSAYQNSNDKSGLLPGINKNHDQLFFISYAQSLCQISQPGRIVTWNNQYSLPNRLSQKQYKKLLIYNFVLKIGAVDINSPSEDRWEFCIDQTIHYLGHAVSALYVKKRFSSEIKSDVQQMVENIRSSIMKEVNSFPWLNSEEKKIAQEKINLLNVEIGHPEFILNNEQLETYYESFSIKNTHISNIFQGEVFLKRKEELLLKQPFSIDHSWGIYSVDVRSRYSYINNNIGKYCN
ncbi:phosphate-regulating neutral endopeptidase-like [Centruroides sculpturatus]|uniref:phosphate-regulating neutral endopeptidase-like n=1 Tax=Centruroides sculpturatus TaxID=218467 RepID=UPI000C6E9976|nr:phosphate-regulating neutral endopeptidase-like [Centruroides sculpturatus]